MKSNDYKQCLEDVKKQRGVYPYDTLSNPCIGDGYFLMSIKEKYPQEMINKAVKECKEIEQKIKAACESCTNNEEEQKMENLKTIEEYTQEMTKEEFLDFINREDLWPGDFGLRDDETENAWDAVIGQYEFKVAVPALPKETLPILIQLQELEIQSKNIKAQQDSLRENLLQAMEKYDVEKWDNELMTITYVKPTTKTTLDSKKIKEELPEVFTKYSKTSNVKSSIRIKLKEDKEK